MATASILPSLGAFPASAEVYREIIAKSHDAIAIIDPRGRYLEQNAAHQQLIGYGDDELAGQTPAIHLGEQTFAAVATALQTTGRFRGEVESRTRDGRTLALELSAFAVRGEDGEPLCYVGIKRDITDRHHAERVLRQQYEQLEILYRMTAALGRAGGVEEIYEEALDALGEAIGARRSSVLLFDPDGVMRFKAWRGISDGYRRAVEGHSPWNPDTPDPSPITVDDVRAAEGLSDELRATILGEGIEALAFFPLTSQRRVLGKFMVYYAQPHAFTPDEVQLAQAIAHHVSFAITRKRADAELRHAEEEQRFLAEAGRLLSSSLDVDATLAAVARLAVPFLADFCLVDVVEEPRTLRRVAAVHADPEAEGAIEALMRFAPDLATRSNPIVRAIHTGRPQLLSEVTPEVLRRFRRSPEHLAAMRALGPRAVLAVPLVARGRTLGAIARVMAGSGRGFSAADLPLAEELARRTAVALDNARLYESATAANTAKTDFLAVMSHELRTPLNAILGYGDLLLLGVPQPLSPDSREQVERIGTSARHLLRIIEQILTFTRLEAGREDVQLEPLELGELVRETTALLQPLAAQKGIGFALELPPQRVELVSDAGKLRQILLNLLSNALKFTEEGVVSISARVREDETEIQVRDTGAGIAPEHLERIFEPFWQGDPSRTRQVGGTGLGLSVTRNLARLMGGDVTVESRFGGGSIFTVRLPLERPAGS